MLRNWMNQVKRVRQEEDGITALETAIILIAFVVVASVFAFTMLSAGTFSTERGKEAIYAGLSEVRSSMEVKGGVIATATTTGTAGTVNNVVFTVSSVLGGEPVNLNTGAESVVVIEYRDAVQRVAIDEWEVAWLGNHNGNGLLESGELAEFTVPLTATTVLNADGLGINTDFALEIKPPSGSVLNLQRTTPAWMELIMDLQ